jgi:diguanylate cyclase (GGDEF)-like protein
MSFRLGPEVVPSLMATAVCLAMMPVGWRRRPAPGAWAFLWLLAALALWSFSQSVGVALTDLPAKVWLHKVRYLGVATAPVAWLAFTLSYTGLASFLSRGTLVLLALVPLATIVLAFTNESHHWLWRQAHLIQNTPFPALAIEHGPWFPVQAAYAYMLVLVATALTTWTLSQSPHQRAQLVTFTAAPLIVCATNLLFILGGGPLPLLDLTPLSFAVGVLVLGWSMSRHRLFDLVPVTRYDVVEGMSEAVLVLDERDRLLDMNAAAQDVLGLTPSQAIGHPPPAPLANRAASAPGGPPARWEITLEGGRRSYEVSASPLRRGGAAAGHVLLLRETTTRRLAEEGLLRAQQELQLANEQLARLANTDALTGLSSRRLFLQRLAEEAARARRHLQPLSVLMLDLDFFKRINDTYGHVVGDQVLVGAAGAISAVKRESDIAGRIGGEEFGLILPATDLEGARSMAERLRRSIGTQQHLTDDGLEFAITASLGVATFASGVRDETELLNLADAALYYAKELGRDRVCVAGGPMPS